MNLFLMAKIAQKGPAIDTFREKHSVWPILITLSCGLPKSRYGSSKVEASGKVTPL